MYDPSDSRGDKLARRPAEPAEPGRLPIGAAGWEKLGGPPSSLASSARGAEEALRTLVLGWNTRRSEEGTRVSEGAFTLGVCADWALPSRG
jgi:hypothetical protein